MQEYAEEFLSEADLAPQLEPLVSSLSGVFIGFLGIIFILQYMILTNGTGEGYSFTQDAEVVHFFAPVGEGAVLGVLRLKDNVIVEESDSFKGCLIIDEDSCYLTVFCSVIPNKFKPLSCI